MKCRHSRDFFVGDDPGCAFSRDGRFKAENWRCALMERLRGLSSEKNPGRAVELFPLKGRNLEVVPVGLDSYAALTWLGESGRTADFLMVTKNAFARKGTEQDARRVLKLYRDRERR